MPLPKLPPPTDIPPDTKRMILAGFKKIVETLQANGKLETNLTHTDILHTPELLAAFIAAFRANPDLIAADVVDASGRTVTVAEPDKPLVCGVSLAQIQQLMIKTCARHIFHEEGESKTVTRTVTVTKYLFFKETTQVKMRVRTKDPGVLREVLRLLAFDWQLPLLADYTAFTVQQLIEAGDALLALRTPEALREFLKFDFQAIRKAKALTGPDFPVLLESRPAAIKGALHWQKDMYAFFRGFLGPRFPEFLARDEIFFMMVATMDQAMIKTYGEILAYIAKENFTEMQRLNLDKLDVLLGTLRRTFGPRLERLLSLPNFAREFLRRQVEGLLHMKQQDKEQLAELQSITWGAAAPKILEWLARQPKTA